MAGRLRANRAIGLGLPSHGIDGSSWVGACPDRQPDPCARQARRRPGPHRRPSLTSGGGLPSLDVEAGIGGRRRLSGRQSQPRAPRENLGGDVACTPAANRSLWRGRFAIQAIRARSGSWRGSPRRGCNTSLAPSPRGRGKASLAIAASTCNGLSPARAGPTGALASLATFSRDHPRSGGASSVESLVIISMRGPSPRWRGQRSNESKLPSNAGSIPAQAGPTIAWQNSSLPRGVHPRAGGANLLDETPFPNIAGPSPRWRGQRLERCADGVQEGSIPALAGPTLSLKPLLQLTMSDRLTRYPPPMNGAPPVYNTCRRPGVRAWLLAAATAIGRRGRPAQSRPRHRTGPPRSRHRRVILGGSAPGPAT